LRVFLVHAHGDEDARTALRWIELREPGTSGLGRDRADGRGMVGAGRHSQKADGDSHPHAFESPGNAFESPLDAFNYPRGAVLGQTNDMHGWLIPVCKKSHNSVVKSA
jgi:hypothetical protein